jgi:hypothetical protein
VSAEQESCSEPGFRIRDPDWIQILSGQWIRIRNPDPIPDTMTRKNREKIKKFHVFEVLDVLFLRAEGLFYFSPVNFYKFLVIKTLDLDWIWI